MTNTITVEPEIQESGGRWRGGDLRESQWRLACPQAVIAELDAAVSGAVRHGESPALVATVRFMGEVRERVADGPGVVVTSGLPFEHWGVERACSAVALIGPLLAPLMHQTHDGQVLYEVRDTGAIYRPGVRRSITCAPQPFHTDGPWVRYTPEFIALHCIRPSSSGGRSRCLSLETLLDDLEAGAPEHHRRLAAPMPWHRQGEHAQHESPVAHLPLYRGVAGAREARLYTDYVHSGARAEQVKLDAEAVMALDALEELAIDSRRWLEFTLDRGEVLWINNRRCAHARSGFDARGGDRFLIRTWHRRGADPRLDALA